MQQSARDYVLYTPEENYIPRCAAVHDLCGYGKCSLGVVIPVLSAAGIDVCPVPTALFSSHTGYDTFTMRDTTEDLPGYIDAWQAIGVEIDAIYSGFLGSSDQIQTILDLKDLYPGALMLIDPVMGDHGERYKTYTQELCDEMGRLSAHADVLTPNLTEASILTGRPYAGQSPSEDEVKQLMDALLNMGAKTVVLKGIITPDNSRVTNYIAGENLKPAAIEGPRWPLTLHGTGDLFASVLFAAILVGKSLYDSTVLATEIVYRAMGVSSKQPDFQARGVSFEPLLGEIARFTAR